TEMGVAATAAGIVTALITCFPNWRSFFQSALFFLLPVILIVGAVYGFILYKVGWQVFSKESFLLFQNIPPELLYFNKRMSGFDKPGLSLISMIGSFLRLALIAISVGVISQLLSRRNDNRSASTRIALPDAGHIRVAQLWMILGLSLGLTL